MADVFVLPHVALIVTTTRCLELWYLTAIAEASVLRIGALLRQHVLSPDQYHDGCCSVMMGAALSHAAPGQLDRYMQTTAWEVAQDPHVDD